MGMPLENHWCLQKGLAFRSKSSMCVVNARVIVLSAATGRPDVLNRWGSSQ
jgi:hypothetical protein